MGYRRHQLRQIVIQTTAWLQAEGAVPLWPDDHLECQKTVSKTGWRIGLVGRLDLDQPVSHMAHSSRGQTVAYQNR